MQDPIEKTFSLPCFLPFLPDFLLPTPGTLTWVASEMQQGKPQAEDGMTQDVFAALCLSAAQPVLW